MARTDLHANDYIEVKAIPAAKPAAGPAPRVDTFVKTARIVEIPLSDGSSVFDVSLRDPDHGERFDIDCVDLDHAQRLIYVLEQAGFTVLESAMR